MVQDLCDRWHQPPSVILAEDMWTVMHMLTVVATGRPQRDE